MRRSVADVSVTVADDVQELEGEREEPGAQQVAHRRQVRDREVVRVPPRLPQVVHQPVRDVQQHRHLQIDTGRNVRNCQATGGRQRERGRDGGTEGVHQPVRDVQQHSHL